MDDCWLAFDVAACRWIVKDLDHNGVTAAAVTALTAGCETPSLIRLAVMQDATWSEFPPVVNQVFVERGQAMPTFDQAVKIVADDLLRQIVDGRIDPRGGTRELYRLGAALWEHPAYHDLSGFIGLDDAFDCAEQGIFGDWDVVAADAVAAAEEILSRGGVTDG